MFYQTENVTFIEFSAQNVLEDQWILRDTLLEASNM